MDIQVSREYSNDYDGIKVKVTDIRNCQVHFVCNDREGIEKEFGKDSPEVEDMLGVEEALSVDKFKHHYNDRKENGTI